MTRPAVVIGIADVAAALGVLLLGWRAVVAAGRVLPGRGARRSA